MDGLRWSGWWCLGDVFNSHPFAVSYDLMSLCVMTNNAPSHNFTNDVTEIDEDHEPPRWMNLGPVLTSPPSAVS
ncbi:hypothetical protein EMCG_07248 [[Emmonsia] crescens]|uniref:Uncharacterized protein n=1 Tax=[Emmonsia] crescens TaxID=73230 RepID=A0A0G2I8W4_9EURO|nr:hypothetical protein EMCG_07248 [Emmonsia crescens UAMH 3008]